MPFTNALMFGSAGGQYDAIVTFSGRESSDSNFAGFYSTPVIVSDPLGIIAGVIWYAIHPITTRGTAGIKLYNDSRYQITVIENYTSAIGHHVLLGEAASDPNEFQAPYDLIQTVGTLWDTSTFYTFTASLHTFSGGYSPALVVTQDSEDIDDSVTGTLRLGISKVT